MPNATNSGIQLDTNFEPISVAAEAVVSRLQKARWRAETNDRYGLIIERRKEGRAARVLSPEPAPQFPAREVGERTREPNPVDRAHLTRKQ